MKPLHVLIVEDVEDDALLLVCALRRAGYDVTFARVETAVSLRAALAQQTWEVIIADYTLPRFSALAALAEVQAQGLDLPFLIVSGTIGEETAVAALHAGAHDYLMKDKLQRLGPAIERALHAVETRQARARAEAALQASEARYRTLVEGTVQGLVIVQEYRVVFANRALATLFGYARVDDLIGQDLRQMVALHERTHFAQSLTARRQDDAGAAQAAVQVECHDGTRRWVEYLVVPVLWEGVPALLATFQDVTTRQDLEERLRHRQQLEAIGTLAGGIAHDFNNMLGVIVGNLDLLEGVVGEYAGALKRIQAAQQAALRAADLTRRLLAFARRQPLNPAPTRVNALITELLAVLPSTLGPEIQIATQLAADLPLAQIDPAGLENVLLNLAINARDAMPGGGTLTVATQRAQLDAAYPPVKAGEILAGPYVWITVSDTGQGMAREILAQVFEPFFTTKPRGQGTGMGLAMVYGFVKQSHGTIRFDSEPGHGTTVHLYLPVAERAAPPAPATPPPQVMAHEQGTVLVVDDEVELLEVTVASLEAMGFTTLQATDGPSALAVVAGLPALDLVLTDIVMPGGMHGVALGQQIRQQHPDVTVIYISGFPARALTARGQLPVDGPLLNKPYRKEQLAEVVRQALARRHRPAP